MCVGKSHPVVSALRQVAVMLQEHFHDGHIPPRGSCEEGGRAIIGTPRLREELVRFGDVGQVGAMPQPILKKRGEICDQFGFDNGLLLV